jgi:hypothetical protein
MLATFSPVAGDQFSSAIVKSQCFPKDSVTVPLGPRAASAAARDGNVCRCQNHEPDGSGPRLVSAVM